MNSLLMQCRPKDSNKEDWEKAWDNAKYVLQPLADVIKKQIKELNKVSPNDFDCPNHYAKMAYEHGGKERLEYVLSLLPDSVDK
ncbi:hypothetical protein UFOVP1528_39 [uncultured Caudovirales phage]|uniref:Uncharacterized protein n=1 Tax=uncultured Caudovirales phage TaxID=2100421 RepID=A0A6J5SF28_9CAUD|nr:hypothetical protein UFOVP905_36 [uncultured Caudovirales phage]CAB4182833.1 hypothetical protein UFOVP1080_24 [uncultured Caudovirales phage]CAB4197273.1 hypothetical protein UFOVP1321_12 [uncultured Caudovirales phage]CAB4212290.1 hypothetical protein UFOVP1432_3 [uncultured Caudovirales phage]CAB5227442.1 hypothetical protein UFOVP1528_39 [uncultured Caudovirales phage]